MPDHVPSIPGDPGNYMGGKVAFAFERGEPGTSAAP